MGMINKNIRDERLCRLKLGGVKNFDIVFKADFWKECLEFLIFKGIFLYGKKRNYFFDAFAEIFKEILGLPNDFAANNLSNFYELTLQIFA